MSGIYIPSTEMPTKCAKCILFGEYGCPFIGAVGVALTEGRRHEGCPLVPVPDHGDLIDKKVLLEDKTDMLTGRMMIFGGQYMYSESVIKNAPTVIPKDGET